MFCSNCGAENKDDNMFCLNCGEKLNKVEATSTSQTQESPKTIEAPAPVVNTQPTQVTAPVHEKCLSAAWHDIKSTPHWFKKILFMGLCNLIPFMGLGTIGFAQQWGTDVARGKRETMPNKIFYNKTFLSGFFEWVAWTSHSFIYGVLAFVISTLFALVPVLNVLIGLAVVVFSWFWNSYVSLAAMKSAMGFDLGDAYSVREIFPAMKRKFGGLFCAYFVPSILCGLISAAIIIVLILIFAAIIAGTAGSIGASIYGITATSNPNVVMNNIGYIISSLLATAGLGLALLVIGIVACCFVGFVMGVLEKLLRYRAIGHWIAMYAPEWAEIKETHIGDKK